MSLLNPKLLLGQTYLSSPIALTRKPSSAAILLLLADGRSSSTRKVTVGPRTSCPYVCRNGKPYKAQDSCDRYMLSSNGDGTCVKRPCPLFDADTETQGYGENTLFDASGKLSYHLQRRHNPSSDAIQQYVNTRKRLVKSAEFVNSVDEEEDMDVQAPAKKCYKSRKLARFDEKVDFKCSDSIHARISQVSFLTHLAHVRSIYSSTILFSQLQKLLFSNTTIASRTPGSQ